MITPTGTARGAHIGQTAHPADETFDVCLLSSPADELRTIEPPSAHGPVWPRYLSATSSGVFGASVVVVVLEEGAAVAAVFLSTGAGTLPTGLGIVVAVGSTVVVVSGSTTDELIIVVVVVGSWSRTSAGVFSSTPAVTSPIPRTHMARPRIPMASSKRRR